MTERIHRCLDGELPRSLLSGDEAAELEALQEAADAARAYVAAPAFPDLAGRVMRALPEPAPYPAPVRTASRIRAALAWMWAPRTLVLRPAYALAGAFALVLAMAFDGPAPRADAAAEVMYVQFRLDAPGARRVALAGSFSDWEPRHELREVSPGVWKAMVAVRPGVHDYLFVVDGKRWVADPAARPADDGFGGTNSRLYLTPLHART